MPLVIAVGCGGDAEESETSIAVAAEAPAAGRAILLIRDRVAAPLECGEHLRGGSFADWVRCRDEGAPEGGWPARDALVPIGCFDPGQRSWVVGGCLPGGEALVSGAGSEIRAGEPAPVVCEASGDWKEGVAAEFSSADGSRFAIDVASHERFSILPAGPGPALSADLERALGSAVARDLDNVSPPSAEVVIDQLVESDLGGDGRVDRLVSVHVPSGEEIYDLFSALYLGVGAEPARWVLLMESQIERFQVLALTDLDRDGAREFVLEARYYEGAYTFLYRFAGEDTVQLGGWGCGA